MKSKVIALVTATATLSCVSTYVILQNRLTSNHPLTLDQQLESNNSTYLNGMLLTDILTPSFGTTSLVGVSKTNGCSAFEKGCFGNQERTEKEFDAYTGPGPQVSLFVYQTETPITSDDMQQLKAQLSTSPYTLKENASASQSGVSSLYDISVMADVGDSQVRVVVRPSDNKTSTL